LPGGRCCIEVDEGSDVGFVCPWDGITFVDEGEEVGFLKLRRCGFLERKEGDRRGPERDTVDTFET
jgi:hypothetical protein